MNIVPIIVIYNKSLDNSSTLLFLENNNLFKDVIVYDNSTINNNNLTIAKKYGWHYLTNNKNDGISVAYNNSINYIYEHKINCDYLLMLDDDAVLNVKFFNEALLLLEKKKADIFVPIIKCNGSIMSPAIIEPYGRIKKIQDISKIKKYDITAINNCMFVKFDVARKVKYNEKLFVDYVDHDFVRRVKKIGGSIEVMNLLINHNISIEDITVSKESRISRFKIYKKDLKEFYKDGFINKLYCKLYIIKMTVKYIIQYKTLDFLFA